jgi:hypothetical protein
MTEDKSHGATATGIAPDAKANITIRRNWLRLLRSSMT